MSHLKADAQQALQQQREQPHSEHEVTKARACPACGFRQEDSGRYCAECGSDLSPATQCPTCHATVPDSGDFCESCGFWLLGGRCRFCYSPLAEGNAFCPECGNPSAGIACPRCGTVGFFDYCPGCQNPLTEEAHALEKSLAAEPEVQAFIQARDEVRALRDEAAQLEESLAAEAPAPAARTAEDEARRARDAAMLANLDALERKIKDEAAPARQGSPTVPAARQAPAKVAPPAVGPEILARRERLAAIKTTAEARQAQLTAPAILERTFTNNQEARRYFMACKPPCTRGWRCFAFDAVHELPMHCARPGDGGEWLVD